MTIEKNEYMKPIINEIRYAANKVKSKKLEFSNYDLVVQKRNALKIMNLIQKDNYNYYEYLNLIDANEFDERAAMLEYYNNMDKKDATKRALNELLEIYSKKDMI